MNACASSYISDPITNQRVIIYQNSLQKQDSSQLSIVRELSQQSHHITPVVYENVPDIKFYASADGFISGGIDFDQNTQGSVYQLKNRSFVKIGELVEPVFGHSMTAIENYLIIFGGRGQNGFQSLQVFNLKNNKPVMEVKQKYSTYLPYKAQSAVKIPEFATHALSSHKNTAYLFGCSNNNIQVYRINLTIKNNEFSFIPEQMHSAPELRIFQVFSSQNNILLIGSNKMPKKMCEYKGTDRQKEQDKRNMDYWKILRFNPSRNTWTEQGQFDSACEQFTLIGQQLYGEDFVTTV
ncbi:Conserved_hypothetical protein [Hexamita inflata]|uniref:Kelch motif family protein n=1 Tax=Hexamita inflata TaxID=28002 RepID=A0AA86REM0_9EUKA|nr:Conserved hypothetical protein [Hexamita inflata]